MSKFRKKPVIIEAWHFTEDEALRILNDPTATNPFGQRPCGDWHPGRGVVYRAWITMHTLEGVMRADVGDWIIRDAKGELYPCKPDEFAATYEPAE